MSKERHIYAWTFKFREPIPRVFEDDFKNTDFQSYLDRIDAGPEKYLLDDHNWSFYWYEE